MTGRGIASLALALLAAVGVGCGVVGDSFELTDAQKVIADMKLGGSEVRVVGAVDRADSIYRVGQPIALTLQVDKNANAAVLRVLSNGTTTLLFPNKEHPSAEVAADTAVPVTAIADSPGTVLFEFIAASRADSFLFDRKRAETGTRAELGATTRAIAREIMTSLKPGPGRETAAAHVAVRVEAP